MGYSGKTTFYGIPYTRRGDILSEVEEERKAKMFENLFRAAILAEGETRVYKEGTYTTFINGDNSVTIRLTGTPAIRGIAKGGFVEKNGEVVWSNLPLGGIYYLYLQVSQDTYFDASIFNVVYDTVLKTDTSYLFLATVQNTVAGNPVLDTSPAGKPTGTNLFELLNSPVDPFGTTLTQSSLVITVSLTLNLATSNTCLIKQTSSSATQAPLTIQNASNKPELYSTGEMRLADSRNTSGVALTNLGDVSLNDNATSILGALKKASKGAIFSLTDAANIATDASKGNTFTVLLEGSRILDAPTNPTDGQECVWRFKQDAMGNRTITLNGIFRFGVDITGVTLSTAANKVDYMTARYNAADNKWDVLDFKKGY